MASKRGPGGAEWRVGIWCSRCQRFIGALPTTLGECQAMYADHIKDAHPRIAQRRALTAQQRADRRKERER